MPTLHALTEADRQKLRRFIHQCEREVRNPENESQEFTVDPAPDCYIAKTPGAGIPARSGTTPGSAGCDIYKLSGTTLTSAGFSKTIKNLGTTAVTEEYIRVSKDKFGTWIVPFLC